MKIDPLAAARAFYGKQFAEALSAHIENPKGFVISTPGAFFLGRQVASWWSKKERSDQWHWGTGDTDAYWIHFFAGDMRAPWPIFAPKKWIYYERRGGIKCIRFHALLARAANGK